MRPIDDYEQNQLAEFAGEGCVNFPEGDPWEEGVEDKTDELPSTLLYPPEGDPGESADHVPAA